jgi:hypothetical protein
MPTHRGHLYDLCPRRPGWSWSAFDLDRITPIGRGNADTKVAAERAAKSCIQGDRGTGDDVD